MKIIPTLCTALLSLALGGCGATLREATSGKIGCSPDDITIDDERSTSGWFLSSGVKTWTATCQGHTYYCSTLTVTSSGTIVGANGVMRTSSSQVADFSCKERRDSVDEAATPRASAPAPSKPKATDPPSGAGGFVFGSTPAAASKLCTDAGKTWAEGEMGGFSCRSGTPTDIGFPTTSRLKFCGGALCGVTLIVSLEDEDRAEWVARYRKIIGALVRKHGAVTTRSDDIPSTCSGRMPQCLGSGTVTLQSEWAWIDGELVRLVLGRIEGVVGIAIVYRSPQEAKPKSDGL